MATGSTSRSACDGQRQYAAVGDRSQAGSDAIACSWLDVYFDNVDTDAATAQTADEALAASTEWDMLQEIEDEGGWSSAVWEMAAAINGNSLIHTGAGGEAPTRDTTYPGRGCDAG